MGGVEVAWWPCLHLVCFWIKDGGGRVMWGKGQEKGRRSKRAEKELGEELKQKKDLSLLEVSKVWHSDQDSS